eukprot:SAG22_NODE_5151_length_1076_cov_1.414534_1_plen_71_part_01
MKTPATSALFFCLLTAAGRPAEHLFATIRAAVRAGGGREHLVAGTLIATVLCESSGTARKGRETEGKAVIT